MQIKGIIGRVAVLFDGGKRILQKCSVIWSLALLEIFGIVNKFFIAVNSDLLNVFWLEIPQSFN